MIRRGTHALPAWLIQYRQSYTVGCSLPGALGTVQAAQAAIPEHVWEPAYDADGQLRPGVWIARPTWSTSRPGGPGRG